MEEKMKWPYRWDLLLRYQLIEIIARWEGRLTTNHLCKSFGIGRQQASKDINNYLKEIAPNNLIYDNSLKGYKPSPSYRPILTTGLADEYLHILSRNKDISHTFEGLDLEFANTKILQVPLRNVEPHIISTLVRAARERKRVEIDYISMQDPVETSRIISPHTLVCTPLRWHVRAYCEQTRDYRDFVLSRFRENAEILNDSDSRIEDDIKWNKKIVIKLIPDTRLSDERKEIVEHDYSMTNGSLNIETRAALVAYTLQALNIDSKRLDIKPEAQQIIIANYDKIENYLF